MHSSREDGVPLSPTFEAFEAGYSAGRNQVVWTRETREIHEVAADFAPTVDRLKTIGYRDCLGFSQRKSYMVAL